MDKKLVLLLCIFHKNGIGGALTLISQSSKYRVTNGQSTSLLLRCAASAGDTDYGHKVNMGSGECSTGDSSNPEIGFTYFDKTDMLQHFLNVVPIGTEIYPVRVQGGFGYNTGANVTFKMVPGWQREAINFAMGDCCVGCSQIILHFVLDASRASTGCHYKNGGWMYGTEVFSGEGDFPTDTETSLDFNFEPSSIKVSKNGAVYLSCPHRLNPEDVVVICTSSSVAVTGLHFYKTYI